MSNDTGQQTIAYAYDAFGAVRSQIGGAGNSFTFTGEQNDPEAGLVFLRSRYYDPQTGRFISADDFPGYSADSQSINPYVYTQNNPVNHTDPKGKSIVAALDHHDNLTYCDSVEHSNYCQY